MTKVRDTREELRKAILRIEYRPHVHLWAESAQIANPYVPSRPGAASGDRPHTGSRKSRDRPPNLQCHSTLSLPTGLPKSPT